MTAKERLRDLAAKDAQSGGAIGLAIMLTFDAAIAEAQSIRAMEWGPHEEEDYNAGAAAVADALRVLRTEIGP